MTDEQKIAIKAKNDSTISHKGYRVNGWLPILETPALRPLNEIKGRMAVMNAMLNIAFNAPVHIIKNWIESHALTEFLSDSERIILSKSNNELTDFDTGSLHWYLESLWALMWATKMIDDLEAEEPVGDNMASLLPNLQKGDNNKKIDSILGLRQELEIYEMLDYYYRLHWYCVDERLNGRQAVLREGLVYERRKSLEWVCNRANDWDNVEMGT
ncbi:DUF4272 domain-containing protein [Hymenobacter sp. 5317J-9]|uniref:DUF4272 domain-containing protein n=1 Tax=Hymenobacter sp. 5317J-9 TaxID=2932250 RepID=UPI001FD6F97A|nr:DUF4272 domain-containing protein [Hymenobacter sp. 5317J-9]UOQ98717.1 DUF4272 domain-containing protein [Hymenobacter sp. 5317J-9]